MHIRPIARLVPTRRLPQLGPIGLLLLFPLACATSSTTAPPFQREAGIHKIKHVIVIMQENRSFDTYFGTYPGADGIPMQNGVPTVCVPDPADATAASSPTTTTPTSTAAARTAPGRRHGRHRRRQDGRLHRPGRARPKRLRRSPTTRVCTQSAPRPTSWATTPAPTSRTTGPTRSTSCCRTTCSSRTPRGACPRTSSWCRSGRRTARSTAIPRAAHNDAAEPRQPAQGNTAARQPDRRSTPGPTSPTCCTSTTSAGATTSSTGTEPDCEDDAELCTARGHAERRTPGHLEPAALLRHREAGRPARQHPGRRRTSTPPPRPARCPRSPGSSRRQGQRASARARSAPASRYVTSLDQRGHAGPRLELAPRSSSPGTTGAASTTTSRRPASTRTATACACPASSSAPTPSSGYIDHQTLSFDAYVKFIEDDFLDGQRLDPKTDGRPDPRPTSARTCPSSATCVNDFDFTQAPRPPMPLPTQPHRPT